MSPLRSAELLAPPPRDRLGGCNLVPHQARTASTIPNTLTSYVAFMLKVLKFLTCVRFDQALYFVGKKLLVKIFLVETLFAHT